MPALSCGAMSRARLIGVLERCAGSLPDTPALVGKPQSRTALQAKRTLRRTHGRKQPKQRARRGRRQQLRSGSEGFGGVEANATARRTCLARRATATGNAATPTSQGRTRAPTVSQKRRQASSSGLEGASTGRGEADREDSAQPKRSSASHTTPGNESSRDDVPRDTRGEPAGGRSQQDGGILREEDRGPGASGGARRNALAEFARRLR